MANHPKFRIARGLLLLLSCITTTTAARLELQSRNTNQSPSHRKGRSLDFPSERLYRAYLIIQSFKSTITNDPKNITATWTGNDICGRTTYLGFYCAAPLGEQAKEELTVTAVILNGYDLHAPKLQGFIDKLPDLALFHAASNNFGGDIPQLPGLGYLYELSVGNNLQPQYSAEGKGINTISAGCITTTINYNFNIGINPKKGWGNWGIPHDATDSKALLLNNNNLSGPFPMNIGFSKVSYLAVANNKLTGPIPSTIEHLQDSLFEVLLLNNQLSGCLPHELGMLHKATVIDAGKNQLTGPIPSSFSCLASVEQLNLGENRLYGQVPDALCKLAAGPAGRLANLTLYGNYFTSVGPACAALIKDGVLDVKNNCIPGLANQRRPAECAAFQSQPKMTCPAASSQVACPAGSAATGAAAAPGERKAREYSSYVTYATLHE